MQGVVRTVRLRLSWALVLVLAVLAACVGVPVLADEKENALPAAAAQGVERVENASGQREGPWKPYDEYAGRGEEPKAGLGAALPRLALSLLVVIVLAYGTICVLKKIYGGSMSSGGGKQISVVENASLGTNKCLHLVEVADRSFVLASTANQINVIAELEQSEASDVEEASEEFKRHLDSHMTGSEDAGWAARSMAGMIRGSAAFLRQKVMDVNALRGRMRDEDGR